MEELFKNKYRTSSFRKPNWDYGSHGLYFVTICTQDKLNYFGEIEASNNTETLDTEIEGIVSLRASAIGKVARQNWLSIPQYHPFIELDEFVLMPNHLHGILFITGQIKWIGT